MKKQQNFTHAHTYTNMGHIYVCEVCAANDTGNCNRRKYCIYTQSLALSSTLPITLLNQVTTVKYYHNSCCCYSSYDGAEGDDDKCNDGVEDNYNDDDYDSSPKKTTKHTR